MVWERNGYTIRPAQTVDAEAYYQALFNPVDPEVARLTGSASHYPKETVIPFSCAALRMNCVTIF